VSGKAKWEMVPAGSRQTSHLLPGGAGFQDQQEYTYKITSGPATGNIRTVRVPAELATPEHVRETIEADAQNHHQIMSMSGDGA